MNIAVEYLLIAASVLLLLSIITSRAFGKWGVPSLLMFLAIGMLAGSDGPGGIYFDDPWLAQSLGVVALVFILFAGGLDTNWDSIRPIIGQGLVLSTLGVLPALFSASPNWKVCCSARSSLQRMPRRYLPFCVPGKSP
jgi:cell volume regulation protein A